MIFFFIALFLSSSLCSMELDICSSESCKKQKDSYSLLIQEQQTKIKTLQEKISLSTSKMNDSFYKIKVDTNECVRVIKGAGAGTCCGFFSAACAISIYGFVDKYVWMCWNIATPSNVMCNIMAFGIPACTCAGCVVGTICAMARCDEKIKIVVD